MSSKFGGSKPLPDNFGSLGTPAKSDPESARPAYLSSENQQSIANSILANLGQTQKPAISSSNIFANLAKGQNDQQQQQPAQTTQSSSLFSHFASKPGESSSSPFSHLSSKPGDSSSSPFSHLASKAGESSSSPFSHLTSKPGEPSSAPASAPSLSTQPSSFFNNPHLNPGVSSSTPTPTPPAGLSLPQQNKSGSVASLFSQPKQASSAAPTQTNTNTSQPFGSSIFLQPQSQLQNQTLQSKEETGQQNLGISRASQPVYFDNLLEKGKKRVNGVNGDSGFGDLPSLQLGLGEIARKARELGGVGTQLNGGATVDSKAHYLLAASGVNPGTTRRDLNSLYVQTFGASNNQQPSIDWDPDSSKYVAQIQQQSKLKMIAEGVERAHRNFNDFLDENVDLNWDIQRRKIYEHFGLASRGSDDGTIYSNPGGKGSFGKSNRRTRPANVARSGQSTSTKSIFLNPSLQKSVIGTPGVGSPNSNLFADVAEKSETPIISLDDRFARDQQAKFGQIVQELNQARLQEINFPLPQEFSSLEGDPGGEAPMGLKNAYDALIEITNHSFSGSSDESKIATERQFAESYLDENPNSARSINIRKRIINGSRSCLEKLFFNRLEGLIHRNPREANVGGVPTTINKVRAYVRIRAARKDLVSDGVQLQTLENDYCWALIFFCLRSGLVHEAAEYVNGKATAFKALDRHFMSYITMYASSPDRRLSRSSQDRINAEFQQRNRIAPENSLDPYRMACYKIVGRCELSKRFIDDISQGMEDWMWLQFSLARESSRVEEVAGDVFGLDELRDDIRKIGLRFFSKGQEDGYGTFFFLQILGGMFEQAVSFLYPYSYISAVHFGIALDFYGLLRVSDFSVSETELLTYNTRELPQINFGRMLGYYTRDFRSGNVEAAVDYLALICLNADLPGALGKSQASLCHEALRELVLETREFAQLLGDIRSDGTRLKGAIERRLKLVGLADQEEFLQTVTVQAASIADDNGRTSDAVLLYHLAEDYDTVITIINRALSEAIAVEIGEKQMRLQPLKPRTSNLAGLNQQEQQPLPGSSLSLTAVDDPAVLAENMISLYNLNALYYQKIHSNNRDACGILLRLYEVKSKVLEDRWSEALDLIDALNLLPLHTNSSIPAIRSHAQAFNALPPTISRNIGPLLLWTITSIGHQRDALASGQFGGNSNSTRKELSEGLLVAAKDLMVFAGLIKYRLGERVWEAITKCGGDVGVYC